MTGAKEKSFVYTTKDANGKECELSVAFFPDRYTVTQEESGWMFSGTESEAAISSDRQIQGLNEASLVSELVRADTESLFFIWSIWRSNVDKERE